MGAEPAHTGDITSGEPFGVEGGVPGGKVGGMLGGTGNMLLPAAQAAILPVPISKIIPEYPRLARQRGIEGQVVVEAIVGTDGRIEPEVTVIQLCAAPRSGHDRGAAPMALPSGA